MTLREEGRLPLATIQCGYPLGGMATVHALSVRVGAIAGAIMTDSATSPFSFETLAPLALEAAFEGGEITSDGGLPWLAAADAEIGVCAEIAAHVPEWRREARVHPLALLIGQRVYHAAQRAPGLRLRGSKRRRHLAPRPALESRLRSLA